MNLADDRRQSKAAVLYLWLSKEPTLRTDIIVFLAVWIYCLPWPVPWNTW